MFLQKRVKFVVLLISELFLQVLLQMHITLLGVTYLLLVKLLSYLGLFLCLYLLIGQHLLSFIENPVVLLDYIF